LATQEAGNGMSQQSQSRRRGLGEGSIYQRSDGKRVVALSLGFKSGGKRYRRRAITETRAAAISQLEKLKVQAGLGLDVGAEQWTLEYWLKRWLDTEVRP